MSLPKPKPMPVLGQNLPSGGNGTGDLLAKNEQGHEDEWTKLVGRGNGDKIFINGQPVTAFLDTGSQFTHVSQDFCLANGIKIHPINQLVNIEGWGTPLNILGILRLNYPSLWGPILLKLKPSYWFCPPLSIRKGCL